jgi:hypothetical protein
MGQLVLLVVAAAWAAVLLPPLLRSRLENRPNSSVLDFRNQLSSLQRAVPARGVGVRSMGRSLAPSMLSRPAATGRPDNRNGARVNGVVSSRMAPTSPTTRPTRRDARMQEATLRPRQHGGAVADPRPAAGLANSRAAEARRRRANVLFLLVLTSVCAGFLAATTDSKAMVYLFAVSMVALGGYVYLLVSINQQQLGPRGGYVERSVPRRQQMPQRRRRDGYDTDDGSGFWDQAPASRSAPRQPRGTQYPPDASEAYGIALGSGQSGRISYGYGLAAGQARRDPRDPYGREAYGWDAATRETTRRAPARNGRHATGQVPVQRSRPLQPVSDHYTQAG